MTDLLNDIFKDLVKDLLDRTECCFFNRLVYKMMI